MLVGPSGLEPPTSCLSGTRSNLLSYDPIWLVVVIHTWQKATLLRAPLIGYPAFRVGGDDGIRFSRELRARSSAVANVHRKFALYRFPFESDYLLQLRDRLTSLLGGDDGIRTHDPLLAGQVLSQLSYTPIIMGLRISSLWLSPSFFRIGERFYPLPVLCQH